jgi:hypothetical protein
MSSKFGRKISGRSNCYHNYCRPNISVRNLTAVLHSYGYKNFPPKRKA